METKEEYKINWKFTDEEMLAFYKAELDDYEKAGNGYMIWYYTERIKELEGNDGAELL
jgi:hypothetical protein